MSHIPPAAMPHAQAERDATDAQPPQPERRRPGAEPTAPAPDRIAASTAAGARAGSSVLMFATVLGGLAALGGVVAAVLRSVREKPKKKGRKRKN